MRVTYSDDNNQIPPSNFTTSQNFKLPHVAREIS